MAGNCFQCPASWFFFTNDMQAFDWPMQWQVAGSSLTAELSQHVVGSNPVWKSAWLEGHTYVLATVDRCWMIWMHRSNRIGDEPHKQAVPPSAQTLLINSTVS
jgi:hypothetical protein